MGPTISPLKSWIHSCLARYLPKTWRRLAVSGIVLSALQAASCIHVCVARAETSLESNAVFPLYVNVHLPEALYCVRQAQFHMYLV